MTLKQFLKPDWRKIVIFILLFLIMCIFNIPFMLLGPLDVPRRIGFPFPFYMLEFRRGPRYSPAKFSFFSLILDIGLWYFISCFIIWIYDRLKKKS